MSGEKRQCNWPFYAVMALIVIGTAYFGYVTIKDYYKTPWKNNGAEVAGYDRTAEVCCNINETENDTTEEPETESTQEEITSEEPTTEEPYSLVDVLGVQVRTTDTEIDVSGHPVSDINGFISQIESLPSLNRVVMCDCGLSNDQMEGLMERFPDIRFVWRLNIGIWSLRTDAVAFSTNQGKVITYRLSNEDCKLFRYCPDLVALDIGHNKVTDLSFLQYLPKLKILILVDNADVNNPGHFISDITYLKCCPDLMYLEFFVGSVTDISVIAGLKNLVDLNISYNPISDIGPLMHLPKIERLFMEHTKITDDQYKLLQKTYPNAQVVLYGKGSIDNGWRTHERFYAMRDMFNNNYVNDLFK